MNRARSPERLALALAGLAACILSVADLFGLLDIPGLQQNLPKVTLLLCGMILTTIATTGLTKVMATNHKIAE